MKGKVILVLDCGATNVRAIAIDVNGTIKAIHSLPNTTAPDPKYRDCKIWDVEEIWKKFKTCIATVLKSKNDFDIAAVTVTAFGVDGAPFKNSGKMLSPVISWQCDRTQAVMENIDKYIPLEQLFRINGVQPFAFNTLNKMIWFKENEPSVLEEMDQFLFIPSIFLYFLTGVMVNDTSMAGTSMMTDLLNRNYSNEIFDAICIDTEKFCPLIEPGNVVGRVTSQVSAETGIPDGIPVIAAGHDTQFAIFGAAADENVPVLSSGTWEILMVRTREVNPDKELLAKGVTTELDPIPGLYNMGVQWIASGAIEWIKKLLFLDVIEEKNIYDFMIGEALSVPPGSNGIRINPALYPIPGNLQSGAVSGINLNTNRGEIFRAVLEALSSKTKLGLKILEKAGKFKADSLICVGGGTKNKLWNQIRADILGIPIRIIEQKETTVLGAALFAWTGIGLYSSPQEARSQINYTGETLYPGENSTFYNGLFDEYIKILT